MTEEPINAASNLEDYRFMQQMIQNLRSRCSQIEQTHFNLYLEKKPADEPHDEGCQKTRYGDQPGIACTCEINDVRHRQAIERAAIANDQIVLASLGSIGQSMFRRHRREHGLDKES